MVYSTCTFNPIEDEAVVAELLVRCGGALQLMDMSGQLPQLKRLPGMRKWRVRDKHRWYDTWQDAEKVRGSMMHASVWWAGCPDWSGCWVVWLSFTGYS